MMTMKTEGVSKFDLRFFRETRDMPLSFVAAINAWRDIMYRMGFVGQDPARYGGFGYGNISQRFVSHEFPRERNAFVISGSGTGHLRYPSQAHYTLVTDCSPEENRVTARGQIPPSSESMSHGAIYLAEESVCAVIHAHCPEIWQNAQALNIPVTPGDSAYGTPEIAEDIRRLFAGTDMRKGVFAMGGHEDGVISFGKNLETAGCVLICCFAESSKLTPNRKKT